VPFDPHIERFDDSIGSTVRAGTKGNVRRNASPSARRQGTLPYAATHDQRASPTPPPPRFPHSENESPRPFVSESGSTKNGRARRIQPAELTPRPLAVLFEAARYHVGKTIFPKVSPVNDAKPAVPKLLAGNHLECSTVGLALLVNRDRSSLNSARLVQPELQSALPSARTIYSTT